MTRLRRLSYSATLMPTDGQESGVAMAWLFDLGTTRIFSFTPYLDGLNIIFVAQKAIEKLFRPSANQMIVS